MAKAPLTTAVVLLLLAVHVFLRLNPGDVPAAVAWASTNVHNLGHHPVAAMSSSAFVVTGNLLPNLAITAGAGAVLERRAGRKRVALIAVAGQVLPTLLTEYGAALAAHWRLRTGFSVNRPDIGVSYLMYAVLAPAVMSLGQRCRRVGLSVVAVMLIGGLITAPGMTSTGHLLAAGVGVAMMARGQQVTRRRSTASLLTASSQAP